ncbi:hypothetical protein [Rhodococcus sp. SGAir0479]|uniref:hypothetical protein n=1 Tax=Rhodococcus sp. SGAir0479 TaxID=2567884 RepID=UPI0010CCBEA4|nr:hypothetical protein [Rhodococcus sp. SGAir0479]QCQ91755.1 hypothetical protein E7742_11275 [Rhodococcus sp. SGAir0479]
MSSSCKECRQPIAWAKSMVREDSWIALDTSPDPGLGSVRKRFVYENGPDRPATVYAEVLKGDDLHRAIANGERLWILHRDSCAAHRPRNPRPAHAVYTPRRRLSRRTERNLR